MSQIVIIAPEEGCQAGELASLGQRLSPGNAGMEFIPIPIKDFRIHPPLIHHLTQCQPDFVLLPHGILGQELGPKLALALGGACVSGAMALEKDGEGHPVWLRPVQENQMVQKIRIPRGVPQIITVIPGSFPQTTAPLARDIRLPKAKNAPLAYVEPLPRPQEDSPLVDARVVVAVGQGIGEEANLELARKMVKSIPGAALGASRPLVDKGWLPHRHQVGITGNQVAPALYLALGISGASQHLAGMAGSQTLIAVNHSPSAPIFRQAHIRIHADVPEFIRAFLENKRIIPLKSKEN